MKKKDRSRMIGAVLCLLGTVIIAVNMVNMYRYLQQQSGQQGEARLQKVSNNMQRTLDKSKTTLLRFAADTEVYLATGADLSEMKAYLKSQSGIFRDKSEGTLTNAFICNSDWLLISDSPIPENYIITERDWYNNTINNGIGNIYITAPYLDRFTGEMCFTSALLLSDGKTIVALDYNLSQIQNSAEQMNREDNGGETLIISREGLVVGYTDDEYLGKKLEDVLPEYVEIYEHLLNEDKDSFLLDAYINEKKCTAFCNRSGDWLFVYTIENDILYSNSNRIMLLNFIPRIAVLISFFAYYMYVRKKLRDGDTRETALPESVVSEEISNVTGNMTGFTKSSRNGIMSIMALTVAVAAVFTWFVLVNWGSDRMDNEIDSYNHQLERWVDTQLQTLNMFVDTISANPSVLDDYDYAVEYLDTIVKNYPEISAAYIARPGNAHEMTMNNGWVPNADYIVAERQWYIDTENSENKMSVSSPYLDARTGLYCVTFSRVVYDAHTGEHIGIFALDFYIENLTRIMEESYSDNGYAFLVDNNNIILNHPNENYQGADDITVNTAGTEYRGIKSSSAVRFIRDYDGKIKACVSRTEPVTGFSVIAVQNVMSVYGFVFMCGSIFIVLLAICIVLLYRLIVRMMTWQEKTRQVLIEEANRASQADRAKSSFLAQMSHEIRTPINAVLGMNEMILREAKEENIINYASNAYNSGNALLSIINDILDISKIEAGRLEITEAEYDMYSLVSDCYHMTAERAEKKGLAFKVSCDETLPSRLKGDVFHIRQIAVNFITNAIKYTDSGVVELSFSGRENGEEFLLEFKVKDTGIGLKPESMEKLFTSFQRFDLERNRTVEGTGLGLSICKQLAELMGGSVKAESVYGEGSEFSCAVPQQTVDSTPIGKIHIDRAVEKINMGEQNSFTAPEARILAVDDVEMNLFVFTSFLKEKQIQIETALSGRKALELTEKNKYDIIFMDHMMPEMDGIETFDEMRRRGYIGPDTPVIMLTANAISGEKEKYLSLGFSSYLTKPVDSGKLDSVLLRYLPKEKIVYGQKNAVRENIAEEAEQTETSALFDVNTGIKYCSGMKEMYFKILKMYVDSGEENIAKIKRFADGEAWSDYVIEVHALKSTSLSAGSVQLSEAAKELETAGRKERYDIIKEKNGSLLELYEKVLSLGRERLIKEGVISEQVVTAEEPPAADLPEIPEEKFLALADGIKDACENYDGDEVIRLCEEAYGYSRKGTPLKPLLESIKASAEDFEYEKAAEIIRNFLSGEFKQ